MPWIGFFGLTKKLTLLLLLVALVPMLGTAYWNLQGALSRVTRLEEQNLKLLAMGVAQRLDQWVQDSLLLVNLLAGDPEVIRLLSLPPEQQTGERESASQTVLHISRMSPDVASAYVMDREGRFLVSSNPQVIGQLRPELEYFQDAIQGATHVSNLRFGATSGHAGAYFAGPIRDEQGRILGVAVIKLLGRVVQTIMEEAGNADITPFLVDRDGVIIHHPDPAIRFHTLRPLPREKIQQLLQAHNFPVATLASLDDLVLAEHMLGASQPGHVRHFHRMTGFAGLKNHTWVVGMSEDEARFVLPLNELFDDTVRSLVWVGTLLIPLSLLIGRRLTRPLALLTRASRLLEQSFTRSAPEEEDQDLRERLNLQDLLHNTDEFGQLSQVFQQMAVEVMQRKEILDQLVEEKTRQLLDQNHQLASAQHRIAKELRIAQTMQLAILPTHFPLYQSYGLYATMRPALETGGDFYDFFILDHHRIGVVVADVSGKGVPAAFFMAISRTVLQNLGSKGLPPAECLMAANNQLCTQNPLELFVTLFYGIFDSRTGEFRYANGGHTPPYHITLAGQIIPLPSPGNIALGVMEGMAYQEQSLRLMPHEKLFFFTDGVTEAFDAAGQAFGEARLVAALAEGHALGPREVVEKVSEVLHDFLAGAEQSDDITCLAFVCHGRSDETREMNALPTAAPSPFALLADATLVLEEQITSLADIPRLASRVAATCQQEAVFPINLVLDEWLTNVISYGFREGESPAASVRLYRQEERWIVEVVDQGLPYNPLDKPAPDTTAALEDRPIGGLGIHFMREMMDQVDYGWEDGHNRLVMVKSIPAA